MTEGMKAPGLRYDLIPPEALAELAYVYTVGAQKYDARNWEKGYPQSLSLRAAMSHLLHDMNGESWDLETGGMHLAQVMWHCATLIANRARRVAAAVDDRSKLTHLGYLSLVAEREMPEVKKYGGEHNEG